jgi:hypothetical protein
MTVNRSFRFLPPLVLALIAALWQINTAQAAACTPPPVDLCAAAPAGQAGQCTTLAGYLADFRQEVCSLEIADATYTPGYAAELARANGNLGPSLLPAWNMDNLAVELDHLAALGVEIIRLDITYPLLTPGLHTFQAGRDSSYTATADDYLAFYRSVVEMIRGRGLQVHIEHSNMFTTVATLNPAPYYATFRALSADESRQRYREERAAEARLLLTELAPDYLTLLTEPDTDNMNFGRVNGAALYSPAQWQAYVDYALSTFPPHSTRLGAGAGTWDTDEYARQFAARPTLDYVDLHVYPARGAMRDYLSNVLDWADLVRSIDPTKQITIGEAWLYKADAAEVASLSLNHVELMGRDVYSYWEPLDTAFIDLLDQAARAKQIAVLTPFWSRYFYAYLDYAEVSTLPPLVRMSAADTLAFANMQAGTLTGTGRAYRDLALSANRLVLTSLSPNHGPQTGPAAAQTVTLSGANFALGSAPQVLFGATPATGVEMMDTNTLRAVVPAGSGTVTVTIAGPDGRSAVKPDAYTYDPPPAVTSVVPAEGREAGGNEVWILGTGFQPEARVFFGAVEAAVQTRGGDKIKVIAPPGSAQAAVKVLHPDEQTGLWEQRYTYSLNPAPALLYFTPDMVPPSGGVRVYLYGQNFAPRAQVFFGEKPATQVIVLNANWIVGTAPAGEGSVPIRVVNLDGKQGESLVSFIYADANSTPSTAPRDPLGIGPGLGLPDAPEEPGGPGGSGSAANQIYLPALLQ